jgi:rRNA maturation protein Nop10
MTPKVNDASLNEWQTLKEKDDCAVFSGKNNMISPPRFPQNWKYKKQPPRKTGRLLSVEIFYAAPITPSIPYTRVFPLPQHGKT